MTNITVSVTKWYHFAIGIVPLLSAIVIAVAWIDSRYLHQTAYVESIDTAKEQSDARAAASYAQLIYLQYMIVEGRLHVFRRMKNENIVFTEEQQDTYNDYVNRMKFLKAENARLMLGDAP